MGDARNSSEGAEKVPDCFLTSYNKKHSFKRKKV